MRLFEFSAGLVCLTYAQLLKDYLIVLLVLVLLLSCSKYSGRDDKESETGDDTVCDTL